MTALAKRRLKLEGAVQSLTPECREHDRRSERKEPTAPPGAVPFFGDQPAGCARGIP